MPILTRRNGKSVMVGDDVTVTVLEVKANQVRIGIDAPKDVTVHRQEVYDRICEGASGESMARAETDAARAA